MMYMVGRWYNGWIIALLRTKTCSDRTVFHDSQCTSSLVNKNWVQILLSSFNWKRKWNWKTCTLDNHRVMDVTARTTNTWLLVITQKIVTESNMAMEDKCAARDVVWPPCYNFLCERLTARRTKHIFLIKNRLFSFRQCYATRTGPGYFNFNKVKRQMTLGVGGILLWSKISHIQEPKKIYRCGLLPCQENNWFFFLTYLLSLV